MDDFTLLPDESVVTRNDDVTYGNRSMFGNGSKGALILTSRRLVLLKKGMFGKVKDVSSFALSDIIISNGQPQVQARKRPFNPSMDVYFTGGEESFRFTWPEEAAEFAAAVISTITGQEVEVASGDDKFIENAAAAMEKTMVAWIFMLGFLPWRIQPVCGRWCGVRCRGGARLLSGCLCIP